MRSATKKNLFTAATYAVVLFLGLLLGQNFADENIRSGHNSILPLGLTDKTTKLQRVLHLINDRYVDSVNIDSMQHLTIRQLVSYLDPYSTYLPPDRVRAASETLEGTFEGIGIEYYVINDTLLVTGVSAGGPAEKGGVRLGDKLLRVGDQLISGAHLSATEVAAKVRGGRGTQVELWVSRKGAELESPLIITRDKIRISSIDAAYVIDTATAYIKIRQFGAQTADDFVASLSNLRKQGAENVILDLRENGGGYLTAATALASQFLDNKQLIVYTEGAHHMRTDYYSAAPGKFNTGKLAVLINGRSASASEIVAGAIQDLKRGIVIGQTSFGKGLIQEQFEFGDGSALNLTVARYYTPSGRCIQKSYQSISGDYLVTPSPGFPERPAGMLHYMGGIVPDIQVSADTSVFNPFYRQLSEKGVISDFVFSHLTNDIPSFSPDHFIKNYQLPKDSYNRLLKFAETKGVPVQREYAALSQPVIEGEMKALVGKYFFGNPVFFQVRNNYDPELIRTLEVLRDQH